MWYDVITIGLIVFMALRIAYVSDWEGRGWYPVACRLLIMFFMWTAWLLAYHAFWKL